MALPRKHEACNNMSEHTWVGILFFFMLLASQGHLLCTTTRRLQRQKAKCSLKPMWGQIQAFLRIWQRRRFWNAPMGRPLAWRAHVGGVGLFMHTSFYQDPIFAGIDTELRKTLGHWEKCCDVAESGGLQPWFALFDIFFAQKLGAKRAQNRAKRAQYPAKRAQNQKVYRPMPWKPIFHWCVTNAIWTYARMALARRKCFRMRCYIWHVLCSCIKACAVMCAFALCMILDAQKHGAWIWQK